MLKLVRIISCYSKRNEASFFLLTNFKQLLKNSSLSGLNLFYGKKSNFLNIIVLLNIKVINENGNIC